jgi:hypothetical protein
MKTYGELTEQEQEQFCSSLLVLTKNSVSEILGSDYPIYDKTPTQILKDIWDETPSYIWNYNN